MYSDEGKMGLLPEKRRLHGLDLFPDIEKRRENHCEVCLGVSGDRKDIELAGSTIPPPLSRGAAQQQHQQQQQ